LKWRVIFDELRPTFAYSEFGSLSVLFIASIYSLNPVWFYNTYNPYVSKAFLTTKLSPSFSSINRRGAIPFGRWSPHHFRLSSRLRVERWMYSRLSFYNFLTQSKWLSSDLSSNYLISQQNPRFVKFALAGRDGRYITTNDKDIYEHKDAILERRSESEEKKQVMSTSNDTIYKNKVYVSFHEYPKKIYPFLGPSYRRLSSSALVNPFRFRSFKYMNRPLNFFSVRNLKLLDFYDVGKKFQNKKYFSLPYKVYDWTMLYGILFQVEAPAVMWHKPSFRVNKEVFHGILSLTSAWISTDGKKMPHEIIKAYNYPPYAIDRATLMWHGAYSNVKRDKTPLFVVSPVKFYRPRMILKHSFDWFAPTRLRPYLGLLPDSTVKLRGRIANHYNHLLFTNKSYPKNLREKIWIWPFWTEFDSELTGQRWIRREEGVFMVFSRGSFAKAVKAEYSNLDEESFKKKFKEVFDNTFWHPHGQMRRNGSLLWRPKYYFDSYFFNNTYSRHAYKFDKSFLFSKRKLLSNLYSNFGRVISFPEDIYVKNRVGLFRFF